MKRIGFQKLFLIFLLLLISVIPAVYAAPQTSGSSGNTATEATNPEWVPTLTLPKDTTIRLCTADSICYDVNGSDPDSKDTLRLSLVSGPISFSPKVFPKNSFTQRICFYPSVSGTYRFIWKVTDHSNQIDIDTVTYFVTVNKPPQISDQSFVGQLCAGDTTRVIYLSATDLDNDKFRYVILSGNGTINDSTGELVYNTSIAGSRTFQVAVYDKCAGDTAVITDTVVISLPPTLVISDTAMFVCDTGAITLDVIAHDPESGPVEIIQVEGPGTFEMNSDSSGRTMFTPERVDSAQYVFVYCLTDDCMLGRKNARVPLCILDTIVVTVHFNKPPELTCPGEKILPACTQGPLCWNIGAIDPENGVITYQVLSGNATLEGMQVCVNPTEPGSFDVIIEATDNCGAKDTCTTRVTIQTNHPPVVTSAADLSMALCKPEQVCVGVSVDDIDQNLATVVANYGVYDKPGNKVCFMADTAGIYTIVTTATDSCGATDSDTTLVTITVNTPPVVHLGADTSFNFCEPQEICLPFVASDNNLKTLVTTFGQIRDGKVCFTPEISGTFTIVLIGTDDCNVAVADTQVVTVTIGHPVALLCPDTVVFPLYCGDSVPAYCVNVIDSSYHDQFVLRILSGNATVEGRSICFSGSQPGQYTVTFEATGTCGGPDTCSIVMIIQKNDPPIVTLPPDFSVFICKPEEICFDAIISDPDGYPAEVVVQPVGLGHYDRETQRVCFMADTAGLYTFMVSANDGCNDWVNELIQIRVTKNDLPVVHLGNDTSFALCEPGQICLPVTITDNNIKTIVTNFGQYNPQTHQVCFTPETNGLYSLVVTVEDSCGFTAVDTINLNIRTGHKPTVSVADTSIYSCYPEELCLPVSITDADNDIKSVTVSRGQYKNGAVCFVPYNAGTYEVVVTVTDSCGNVVSDTATVTVRTDQLVNLVVPNDTSVFLCEPDTLCFPIGGIPADATVKIFGTNVKWDPVNKTVCFYSDCCLQNIIRVEVTTPCGTKFTKSFTVSVQTNSAPIVAVPRDTTIFACEQGGIVCLPVAVNDIDSNVSHVAVSFGEYDAYRQRFCFAADTAGVYTIVATATDSCGLFSQATATVRVNFNHAPTVDFIQNDQMPVICGTDTVQHCGVVKAEDIDSNIVNISVVGADFDPVTKQVCWNLTDSGDYTAVITVTDACGAIAVDTVTTGAMRGDSVHINCQQPQDNESFCKTDTIKVPQIITGTAIRVVSNVGYWKDGYLYLPTDSTKALNVYNITLIAQGICNTDTCNFTYLASWIDKTEITCPNDTTVALCTADTLSFPIHIKGYVTPLGLSVNSPAYFEGFRLRVPVSGAGRQEFTIIANGMCGSDTCSFNVTSTINTPPAVESRDTTLLLCKLQEVCLPIHITDVDGNIVSITTSVGSIIAGPGRVAPVGGGTKGNASISRLIGESSSFGSPSHYGADTTVQVCFTPDRFGDFKIAVTVTDACTSVIDTVVVTVNSDGSVAIVCPTVEPATLCKPDTLCVPMTITGSGFVVTTSFGTFENGNLCFAADTNGTYKIKVIATASCNADTCDITIPVTIYAPIDVSCRGTDTTVLVCDATGSVFVPVSIFGNPTSVVVSPEGAKIVNGQLEIPITGAGSFPIKVVASNQCYSDSCGFTLNVRVNQPPVVTVEPSIDIPLCSLGQVCIKFHVTDPDNNLVELRASRGVINDSILCFTPDAFGDFPITIKAIDACNDTTTVQTVVHVIKLDQVQLTCPSGVISVTTPLPDSVRINLPITPAGATVTVTPNGRYDAANQQLVVYVAGPGTFTYKVVASTQCGSDSCLVTVEAGQYLPAFVECQGTLDTTLCLNGPDTICFPVTITGTAVNVTVSPVGTYANGQVCVPVTQSGTIDITIIASNLLNADTCTSRIDVLGGHPPTVQLPGDTTVTLCEVTGICLPVTVTKTDFGIANISVQGARLVTEGGIYICFDALRDTVQTVIVTVIDSCGKVAADTLVATIKINKPPVVTLASQLTTNLCAPGQVCVPVTVEDANLMSVVTNGTYNAETHEVCFNATTSGVYNLTLTATDSCGASVTRTSDVTVTINNAPIITAMRDTTVYMCAPQYICLPTAINDPDGELLDIKVNRGKYENGAVCFAPYDSGTYQIIVTATDKCGAVTADTANVQVRTDQGLTLICPNDTSIFQCRPDTLCFPIGGIPEGATVRVVGTGVKWNPLTKSVCFYSDCCLENKITVYVTTECGTYSCSFTVKVQTNSAPIVALPRDTTVLACSYEKICLPVGVNDIDTNVVSITAVGGEYDAYRQIVCVTPTQAGTYPVIITATDACGLKDVDTVVITIRDNQPPTVVFAPSDTLYQQCAPTQICLPVTIADPDGNIAQVGVEGGTYNASTGQVCLLPTGSGRYCVTIVVVDKCGARREATYCVRVESGEFVDITCPTPRPTDTLCTAGPICIPVAIAGVGYTVQTSYGNWSNGQLCFNADTSGLYTIKIKASAQCNADSCLITQAVKILDKVDVACPGNKTLFLCVADTLCYDLTLSSSVTGVTVSAPAYISGNQVCVPVLQAGLQTIRVIATGTCGADTCSFTVTSTFNSAPIVNAGRDSTLTECSFKQVCLPFTVTDANSNIAVVTVTSPATIVGNTICFTPTAYGISEFIITATDSCGSQDKDTVKVTYNQGASADIVCPSGAQFASLCKPDTVYIVAPITPSNAVVTVTPSGTYNPATGKIAFYVTSGGTKRIKVKASAQCGSDSCEFDVQVTFNQAADVVCPTPIDTLMCLATNNQLCFPVTVTGTGVQVTVKPAGTYSAGVVCIPVTAAGRYDTKIIATGVCGTDSCIASINVRANQKPVLQLPTDLVIERCPQDTNTVCVAGFRATDAEGPVTLSRICGIGSYTAARIDSGSICFKPTDITSYQFCFQATDGCHTITDTFTVTFVPKPDCDVCVKVSIEGGSCSPVGLHTQVVLKVETNDPIGGFDLLVSYDASALVYQSATIAGSDITGWEYFTWKLGGASCGAACPSGLVRFVGIADVNNGANHPPDSSLRPNGALAYIDFLIKNDQNLGGQFVPVSFVWYDCADNSFSNPAGTVLYVDRRIYNNEDALIWDETNNTTYPESSRPFGIGAPDSCLNQGGKTPPTRCIDFFNGGVCIISADSIDDRGDINMNGLAYEVADAVMFTNYFIQGLSAFGNHVPGSIAASDVNADGITLTVSDLALLIRIIVGDADPIPKLNPYLEQATVQTTREQSTLRVTTETVGDIGAAYFVWDIDPTVTVDQIMAGSDASDMKMISSVEGGQLRVLIYDIGRNRIEPGERNLIDLSVSGAGSLRLNHVELVDYHGRPYTAKAGQIGMPDDFALNQNYPNPFNPSTLISFGLPQASDWTLRIFNITGALVREFSGTSEAGTVEVMWDGLAESGGQTASGIYLYRLSAGRFTDAKKMILLK